jgi:hypothetical protein
LNNIILIVLLSLSTSSVWAQQVEPERMKHKSTGGALLRSVALPGWGHAYVRSDWQKSRSFLAADVAFLAATLGYRQSSQNALQSMYTNTRQKAGVEIKGRSKSFQLAVAQFNSLSEYNTYQEQTRNWDRFLENTPENQWTWSSEQDRFRYNELRSRQESHSRQAGIFIGLMVVNRVVSGVSSMVTARNHNRNLPIVYMLPTGDPTQMGVSAHMRFEF